MIETATHLTGRRLHATDDRFGSCRDLYFDDDSLAIVYLVADTRKWLPGRKTLLSPQVVDSVEPDEIRFKLTREDIEDSPPIEEDLPVSREYETDLFSHYGWSPYWGTPGLTDPAAGPVSIAAARPYARKQAQEESAEPRLRSLGEVIGYKVQASGDRVGKAHDFLVDTESWTLRYIAIDTHPWIPGGIHLVDASHMNWLDSQAGILNLTCLAQEIKSGPAYGDFTFPCETDTVEQSRQQAATV